MTKVNQALKSFIKDDAWTAASLPAPAKRPPRKVSFRDFREVGYNPTALKGWENRAQAEAERFRAVRLEMEREEAAQSERRRHAEEAEREKARLEAEQRERERQEMIRLEMERLKEEKQRRSSQLEFLRMKQVRNSKPGARRIT
eukprot:4980281-Pyramimonas_sp.AAC.2